MFSINNKMISSVPIHHNSFTNELMWRTHFPVKQESLDDSATTGSPEIYADTGIDNDIDQSKSRSDHLARVIPPSISTSPTMPAHQGIYVSPNYQQRDLSSHFKMSPNRMSPYSMRGSPSMGHHKTSPNSDLSSTSPSSLYHQKISPAGCVIFQSTPDKCRASPRHSDFYRTSPNISGEFHRTSPTSHTSGVSSDNFQSPQNYSHLQHSLGVEYIPDIYRSLNFQLPKTPVGAHLLSPHLNAIRNEEPLNMNSKTLDLSPGNQRLSPFSNPRSSPNHVGNASQIYNDQNRVSPNNTTSGNPCSPSNQESHDDSIDDSRSPSPAPNLKKASSETIWNSTTSEAPVPASECNDVPSLKCVFCSYNTKSRIQLNKHMRDAHNESQIIPFQHNKELTNESEEDNENETHSSLSEDFMMDEYDEEDGESEEFAVNINKVTQNANNNKRTNYKCKKCTLTFKDKDEYYVHQKENHIKPEKLLECKLCPFVTEYKHHHEYHIKNHFKMKPFKCSYSNCKYSCNNQSMLNSHVKSHKSFYQFHCKNCNYATKYMHSFKLHLRKNNHEKGVTLNEDGSVNNDIIIDIHGTRRGPKRKSRKMDEIALQNINNNNCITETIKKTIHHEPESEYNNNITMSSNNCSSRSNSPLSSVHYNNNNNESYYLNTKLFVYSQMATMMNEKAPEIWPKDFAKTKESNLPEIVDLSESPEEQSEMLVDVEVPLDLSKSFESKPQSIIEMVKNSYAREIAQSSNGVKAKAPFFGNQNVIKSNQSLIKIENKSKTSADMIRIVGKNNFHLSNGGVMKNKNKIKLCKNSDKSLKNAIDKTLKVDKDRDNDEEKKRVCEKTNTSNENCYEQLNITPEQTNQEDCDEKMESNTDSLKVNINVGSEDSIFDDIKKTPKEENATFEVNQKAISSNKNRRRKGKAYKLQINNDYVNNEVDDVSVNEDHKEEEKFKATEIITTKVHNINAVHEGISSEESTLSSKYENMQMDYLKQIQNQYIKTFQQTNLENYALPLFPTPHNSILSNLNNNVSSSQIFDSKSQHYQQNNIDFVGSHLKNLENINSHLFQKSLIARQNSDGMMKPTNNIANKKTDAQNMLSSFLNKRNEMNVNNNRLWYKCELCDIQYLDELIYSIHMRYHNVEHPYKCNLCGLQTNNKLQFNLHIIQTPH